MAARVSIHIEEECNLHGHAAATAKGVIGAVAGVAPWYIHVNRVVAVGNRVRDFLAYFGHNRGSRASVGGCRSIEEMAIVRDGWAHLSVRVGEFLRSLR